MRATALVSLTAAGSDAAAASAAVLYSFIRENQVKSMVDAPCGSFHWMPSLLHRLNSSGHAVTDYTGLDVVDSVIAPNAAAYAGSSSVRFAVADLTKDALPKGKDLVMSRDALQHLSLEQVKAVLRAFQAADPRFLLVGSYPSTAVNVDITTGDYQGCAAHRRVFSCSGWPADGAASPPQVQRDGSVHAVAGGDIQRAHAG